MISITQLQAAGFLDLSEEKNGGAYRITMPNGLTKICWYREDPFLRLQTKGSGFTIPLKGIHTMPQLNSFWRDITGEDLIK